METIRYHKINPEFKARWLLALRSGEYKQTKGRLHESENYGGGYCCLGVGAKIEGVPERERNDHKSMIFSFPSVVLDTVMDATTIPPSGWQGLCHAAIQKVSNMNDNGVTFPQIADWIEVNL